jgi:hypothetical protein
MKFYAKWWATLALAMSVSGQAFGQNQTIEVQPAPVHEAVDADQDVADSAPAAAVGGQVPGTPDIRPPAAPAELAPPPVAVAPDPGPRVAIARRLIDDAGAFDGYMHRAAAIKADFNSGPTVARAVALGSVYEPTQLDQGAIAYAALIALQDPLFVQAVQEAGADPRAREAFASRLADRPEAVLEAGAARRAATRVSVVLGRMGADLVSAGEAVKQSAYDVQRQDWSRGTIAAADEHLARIKAESAMPISLVEADQAHLIRGLSVLRASDGAPPAEAETATAVVTRGMALAALAILGKAGDDQAQRIDALLNDPLSVQCLKMAKLNDYECLAVAGPHYENLFCLGNHAMMDTGKCIVAAAGSVQQETAPPADRQSVLVPVAMTSGEGESLERNSVFHPVRATAGVSVPVAGPVPPANYSPYAGPVDP